MFFLIWLTTLSRVVQRHMAACVTVLKQHLFYCVTNKWKIVCSLKHVLPVSRMFVQTFFSEIYCSLLWFCLCWNDNSFFPVDSNMSLDILCILSLASASMVCSCERVSKECNLFLLFYKTRFGLPFCRELSFSHKFGKEIQIQFY